MLFGLKNSPRTFQHKIYVILSNAILKYALAYLDDIFVFLKSGEEHKTHLRPVLSLLVTDGVSLSLNRCLFLGDNIDYLGHVIRPADCKFSAYDGRNTFPQEPDYRHGVEVLPGPLKPPQTIRTELSQNS